MSNGLKEFGEFLKNAKLPEFKPYAFYEPHGGSVSCFLEDTQYYAEDINDQITVFRATEDDRIVGTEIYGVRKMVQGSKIK